MSEINRKPHITVLGDLILDRYLIGDATKLNPEMPGVVIRVDREDDRLGGAAAVAMLAAGFGAKVTLAGVVGDDGPGNRLRELLDSYGIESHVWVDGRPTTWKQRIVTWGQLRPDRCDREVTKPISDHAAQFLSTVPLVDMLLVSDYGKGVCTPSLLKGLGSRARAADVPIFVDPARGRHWSDYGQVTLIKANWGEACAMGSALPPLALAISLADQFRCDVVVTLGQYGLVSAQFRGSVAYLPATQTLVRDVCGAGDTVLAALSTAIFAGKSVIDGCKHALGAAATQLGTVGIDAV